MDNDFKRSQQRPMGRSFGQPIPPRPLQPRPQTMPSLHPASPMRPTRPTQSPAPVAGAPALQPMRPLQPRPASFVQPQAHPQTSRPSSVQPSAQPMPVVHHDNIPQQEATTQFTPPPKKKSGKAKKIAKIVFFVFLIGLLLFGSWLYYSSTQKELTKKNQEIIDLTRALKQSDQARSGLSQNSATSTVVLTQDDKNVITGAVTNNNYASIEQKLGDPVLVIIAGTDGVGRRSPEQAVSDMNYIKSAKQPWNFNLSAEELDSYRGGDYARYFPEGAIVGKSADNKVVSFSLTSSGKIAVVFMCSDASML